MEPWVAIVIAVVAVIAIVVAQRAGWIDLSNKARTSGSRGIVGVVDEVFAPTRHEAQIELDRQTRLPAPAPIPGDGPGGGDIYRGTVRIELGGEERER